MNNFRFEPFAYENLDTSIYNARLEELLNILNKRRTVRNISTKPIPEEIIEKIVSIGASAPSGANKQPWKFCVVSNPDIKKKIRVESEKIEYENYTKRFPDTWKKDLAFIGTDYNKPFLEKAPALIVVFKEKYSETNNEINKHYYVSESCGIAIGFLLTAIHFAGLVTIPYTPSPMGFLSEILNRPDNETPFIVFPIGYPNKDAMVPVKTRKELNEVMIIYG